MSTVVPLLQAKIFQIRNQKVMLDSDLAALYGVETRALVQQIKRNSGRFPKDFAFQLTVDEWKNLRSQNVISSSEHGGRRTRPYAFTEHGVAMLSSVLRSERAVAVNIEIVRAFIAMRRGTAGERELEKRIEQLEDLAGGKLKAHEKQLAEIFTALRQLTASPSKRKHPIGFRLRD